MHGLAALYDFAPDGDCLPYNSVEMGKLKLFMVLLGWQAFARPEASEAIIKQSILEMQQLGAPFTTRRFEVPRIEAIRWENGLSDLLTYQGVCAKSAIDDGLWTKEGKLQAPIELTPGQIAVRAGNTKSQEMVVMKSESPLDLSKRLSPTQIGQLKLFLEHQPTDWSETLRMEDRFRMFRKGLPKYQSTRKLIQALPAEDRDMLHNQLDLATLSSSEFLLTGLSTAVPNELKNLDFWIQNPYTTPSARQYATELRGSFSDIESDSKVLLLLNKLTLLRARYDEAKILIKTLNQSIGSMSRQDWDRRDRLVGERRSIENQKSQLMGEIDSMVDEISSLPAESRVKAEECGRGDANAVNRLHGCLLAHAGLVSRVIDDVKGLACKQLSILQMRSLLNAVSMGDYLKSELQSLRTTNPEFGTLKTIIEREILLSQPLAEERPQPGHKP